MVPNVDPSSLLSPRSSPPPPLSAYSGPIIAKLDLILRAGSQRNVR